MKHIFRNVLFDFVGTRLCQYTSGYQYTPFNDRVSDLAQSPFTSNMGGGQGMSLTREEITVTHVDNHPVGPHVRFT